MAEFARGYEGVGLPSVFRGDLDWVACLDWAVMANDLDRWEQDQYNKAHDYEQAYQKKRQPEAAKEADETARETFENAAREIREEKKTWRPTWQALGLNYDRTSLWKSGKEDSTGSSS